MSNSRPSSPPSPLAQSIPASAEPQAQAGAAAHSDGTDSNPAKPVVQPQGNETVLAVPSGHQVQQVTVVQTAAHAPTDAAVTIATAPAPSVSSLALPPSQPPSVSPATGKIRKPNTLTSILRPWIAEILACLVAVLMIVVIVVVLAYFDHRRTSKWHVFSWKINSVIAFFTAIMEAAVAYVVGSCMGQLRWLWYHRGAVKLKWMDRLTDARTAPGALAYFLTKGPWKHMAGVGAWAGLGALLVLLLVGVGVFTQNVITQYDRFDTLDLTNKTLETWGAPPEVPVANYYWYQYQYADQDGHEQPEMSMVSAMNSGFLYYSDNSGPDTLYEYVGCGTGNCTFGNYSTLAVCSRCADISDQITIPCNSTSCSGDQESVYLPNRFLTLNTTSGFWNMTSDTFYPNETVLSDTGPLIDHVTALANLGTFPYTQPSAVECALYWCVQTLNANYSNTQGDPQDVFYEAFPPSIWTDTTASAKNFTPGLDGDITLIPPSCFINGSEITKQHNASYLENCTFSTGGTSHHAIQNYLAGYPGSPGSPGSPGFLQGVIVSTNSTPTNDSNHWNVSSLAANAINAGSFSGCQQNDTDSDCTADPFTLLDGMLGSMALYMSNEVRKESSNYTFGTMQLMQSHYDVEWGWLAYPIIVVLIAIIFLLATMVRSRHTDPWKASVLALILHGLDDEARNDWHELDDAREMRNVRQTWLVTLDRRDGTYAFRRESVAPAKLHAESLEKLRHGAASTAGEAAKGVVQAYGNS